MRKFQYSVLSIFGVVSFSGASLAMLAHPTPIGAVATSTCTFVILLIAVLVAILRRRSTRACAIGFAVFGWTLLIVPRYIPHAADTLGTPGALASEQIRNRLYEWLHGETIAAVVSMRQRLVHVHCFWTIADCSLALLFAGLGGVIARLLHRPTESP